MVLYMTPIALSGSQTIELQSSVATANSITYSFTYADTDGTTFTEGVIVGGNTNAALFAAVPAPSAGFRRIVRSWNVYNASAGNVTITMRVGGITQFSMVRATGERIQDGISYLATGAQNTSGTAGTNAVAFVNITNSHTIAPTGSFNLTYASTANRAWYTGSRVRLTSAANVNNFMEGIVTGTPTTTATAVQVDTAGGSGTLSDFRLVVVADNRLVVQDTRTNVSMTSNGTTTIDSNLNGTYTDYDIEFAPFTGGTAENNLIDITNAQRGRSYVFTVTRDGTAGTKTINFAGSGRTYNRSWLTGTQAIGINERWLFIVRAESATVFDVVAQRTA